MQTFVIRVWVPGSEEGDASDGHCHGLRGLVEHVGSGRCAAFRGSDQLLSLVHASLEAAAIRRNAEPCDLPPQSLTSAASEGATS